MFMVNPLIEISYQINKGLKLLVGMVYNKLVYGFTKYLGGFS